MEKDKTKIPRGYYCYDENGKCPYHRIDPTLPDQENGVCDFLGVSDYDSNEEAGQLPFEGANGEVSLVNAHSISMSLLWDSCKECGINTGETESE